MVYKAVEVTKMEIFGKSTADGPLGEAHLESVDPRSRLEFSVEPLLGQGLCWRGASRAHPTWSCSTELARNH